MSMREKGKFIAQGNNVHSEAPNLPNLTLLLSRKWSGNWCPAPPACAATSYHLVGPLPAYLLYLSCYGMDQSPPGVCWGLGKLLLLQHVVQQKHWKRWYLLNKSQVCLLDSSFQLSFRRQFKSIKFCIFSFIKGFVIKLNNLTSWSSDGCKTSVLTGSDTYKYFFHICQGQSATGATNQHFPLSEKSAAFVCRLHLWFSCFVTVMFLLLGGRAQKWLELKPSKHSDPLPKVRRWSFIGLFNFCDIPLRSLKSESWKPCDKNRLVMKHDLRIEVSLKIVLVVPWGCSSASNSGCIFTAGKQGCWSRGGWVYVPVGSLAGASRGFWAFMDKMSAGLWQPCFKNLESWNKPKRIPVSSFSVVCMF